MITRWISLAMYGKYVIEKKYVQVTVAYSSTQFIAESLEHGILLREDKFLVIGEKAPLSFSLRTDNWKTAEKPDAVQPGDFDDEETDIKLSSFKLTPNEEMNLNTSIMIRVKVTQKGQISKYLNGTPVNLRELASIEEPKPKPTEKELDAKLYASYNASKRSNPVPPIFHPALEEDQRELNRSLQYQNPGKYKKLLTILAYKPSSNTRSLTLMQLLQMWMKECNSQAYVWKNLKRALVQLDWEGPRKSLEILYEKDQILKSLSFLKENVRFVDIKNGLIDKKIVTDPIDRQYLLNPKYLERDKLDYLFRKVLLSEIAKDSEEKILNFNQLLIKKGYIGIVEMLTLGD